MRFPSVVPNARRGTTILNVVLGSPAADVNARTSPGRKQDGQSLAGNQARHPYAVANKARQADALARHLLENKEKAIAALN
jgi:hypothetical protein